MPPIARHTPLSLPQPFGENARSATVTFAIVGASPQVMRRRVIERLPARSVAVNRTRNVPSEGGTHSASTPLITEVSLGGAIVTH